MKTTVLKLATVLLMLTAENKTFAAAAKNLPVSTDLTWINNFYKIEVHGNVRLHLLSGEKNRVQMSGTYYNHNAVLQVVKGVLRITCYSAERLDVWVTANELSELTAYDNVLVNTEGTLTSLDLNVELFNKAKADLNLDCCFTHVKLNDCSMADVSGKAMESDMAVNYASTLNATNFIVDQMSKKCMDTPQKMTVEHNATAGNGGLFSSFKAVKGRKL